MSPLRESDAAAAAPATESGGQGDGVEESRGSVLSRALAEEFRLAAGSSERVAGYCTQLQAEIGSPADPERAALLSPLVELLAWRGAPLSTPLFDLLELALPALRDPWPWLAGMAAARDADQAARSIALGQSAASLRHEPPSDAFCRALALRVEREEAWRGRDRLEEIGALLALLGEGAASRAEGERGESSLDAGARAVYHHHHDLVIRRLAARVLDRDGRPAPLDAAEKLLGPALASRFAPYLVSTLAGHLDLLCLATAPDRGALLLSDLDLLRERCGMTVVHEALAVLGWGRVRLGLELHERVSLRRRDALPLRVRPEEAALFERRTGAQRGELQFLMVAHGAPPEALAGEAEEGPARESPAARFRALNIAHAEVLSEFLRVGALESDRVRATLERMAGIVASFLFLFSDAAEECRRLPSVWTELRARIEEGLGESDAELSVELTRLVQAFEDPRSLDEVGTLHGLKRYLHQRGLALGLKLRRQDGGSVRTVDLLLARPREPMRVVRAIEYVAFEPGAGDARGVPAAVRLVADAFALALQFGHERFPRVSVFLYGHDVHYYAAYGSHPAFLHVNYAPPLRGGLLDLEFYGVSKTELSAHPAPELPALAEFFRRLELDFTIERTRVRARYDKERTLDLGTLCEVADSIFRLLPVLMDIDWVIGSLRLREEAKRTVAEAWAESFLSWGVLPIGELLTRDRLGILLRTEATATGEVEVAWAGDGPYADRFRTPPAMDETDPLRARLRELGVELGSFADSDATRAAGQIAVERYLLRPLRDALARGELLLDEGTLRRTSPTRFQTCHAAERFADLLAAGGADLEGACACALILRGIETGLGFETTGALDGYEVQSGKAELLGERILVHCLRDEHGVLRLGCFTNGGPLGRRRATEDGAWERLDSIDAAELARLLRRSDYAAPDLPGTHDAAVEAEVARAHFERPSTRPIRARGELVIPAIVAAPGRAVGPARLPASLAGPADAEGAVLVLPTLRPEDYAFLLRAAAVITTGGGILSHAGLVAVDFGCPALLVEGKFRSSAQEANALTCRVPSARETLSTYRGRSLALRTDREEHEMLIREGDIVEVDADEGIVRCLGHAPEVLSMHESFRQLRRTASELETANDPRETLLVRGRAVKARHRLERILPGLSEPALAGYAVRELLSATTSREALEVERGALLSMLLANPRTGEAAREKVGRLAGSLSARYRAALDEAERRMPEAPSLFELLALRREVLDRRESLLRIGPVLRACDLDPPEIVTGDVEALERWTRDRADLLGTECLRELASMRRSDPALRHRLRDLDRIDRLPGGRGQESERAGLELWTRALAVTDAATLHAARRRWIVGADAGGIELLPMIGAKAANLAEVTKLVSPDLVPPWFVVTDTAFRSAMQTSMRRMGDPLSVATLGERIDEVLAQSELSAGAKASAVAALWERVELPAALCADIRDHYRGWTASAGEPSMVAVRSSALEEDREAATRAGEFDTFLFVRGESSLLEHLRRAWCGLWNERALRHRELLGPGEEAVGGGVIVQRMVEARVAGVLQTVNLAERAWDEIVINAGLGLGEGIVSGAVVPDQIVVRKTADIERGQPIVRYRVREKREQVVWNRRAGVGTIKVETLAHQRLRPALEYPELVQLVRVAVRLEREFGYPIDVEFALEGARLWILQVRPVPSFAAVLADAIREAPRKRGEERS